MLPWNEAASAFANYFALSPCFQAYKKLSANILETGQAIDPADNQAVNKGFLSYTSLLQDQQLEQGCVGNRRPGRQLDLLFQYSVSFY